MNNYTERLELPEGQWADLLTRLPTARAQIVLVAIAREQDIRKKPLMTWDPVFTDAVARAHLVSARLKNYLHPDQWVGADEYGLAAPEITDEIKVRATVLYAQWSADATPGPKEPSTTDSPTPTGAKQPRRLWNRLAA